MAKLRVQVLCFHYFTDNYNYYFLKKKNKISNFFDNFDYYYLFEKKKVITGWLESPNDNRLFSNL